MKPPLAALLTALVLAPLLVACHDGGARGGSGPPAAPAGSSMLRGDSGHSGAQPGPGPSGTPRLLWSAAVDLSPDPLGGPDLVAPAVADGVVYVGGDGLTAYAANDGRRLWGFQPDRRVGGTPAVAGGVVYAGDEDGVLHAVDARTGEERWRYDVGLARGTSPVVADGRVYFASARGALYALDAGSGDLAWSAEADVMAASDVNSGASSPAVSDGLAFVAGFRRRGELFEDEPVGSVVGYAADDRRSANPGAELKSFETTASLVVPPAVGHGAVFVVDEPGGLTVLSADDFGEQRWEYPAGLGLSMPAFGPELVYVSDRDRLVALGSEGGDVRWAAEGSYGAPALAGGAVYACDADGAVHAFDAASGARLWEVAVAEARLSSPVVVDGTVFVVDQWRLYALGADPN